MAENQLNKITHKINQLTGKQYSFLDKMFLIEILTKPKLILFSQIFITYNLENKISTKNNLVTTILEEYVSFTMENELKISSSEAIYLVNSINLLENSIKVVITLFSHDPNSL